MAKVKKKKKKKKKIQTKMGGGGQMPLLPSPWLCHCLIHPCMGKNVNQLLEIKSQFPAWLVLQLAFDNQNNSL